MILPNKIKYTTYKLLMFNCLYKNSGNSCLFLLALNFLDTAWFLVLSDV